MTTLARLAGTVVAGLGATWTMDRADKLVYNAQSEAVHRREAELEDLTGPGQLARAVMRAAGREPSRDEAVRWGRVAHVSFGVLLALVYVPLSQRARWLRGGGGALYGALAFPANAVVVPALGLTPPTSAFPPQTALRGFLYHLAYGIALETQVRVLRLRAEEA